MKFAERREKQQLDFDMCPWHSSSFSVTKKSRLLRLTHEWKVNAILFHGGKITLRKSAANASHQFFSRSSYSKVSTLIFKTHFRGCTRRKNMFLFLLRIRDKFTRNLREARNEKSLAFNWVSSERSRSLLPFPADSLAFNNLKISLNTQNRSRSRNF